MRTPREEAHEAANAVYGGSGLLGCSWHLGGTHSRACDALTAAIEARDAEHAEHRESIDRDRHKLTLLVADLSREVETVEATRDTLARALERIGSAPDDRCYEAGGIARAALAAITRALTGEGAK